MTQSPNNPITQSPTLPVELLGRLAGTCIYARLEGDPALILDGALSKPMALALGLLCGPLLKVTVREGLVAVEWTPRLDERLGEVAALIEQARTLLGSPRLEDSGF